MELATVDAALELVDMVENQSGLDRRGSDTIKGFAKIVFAERDDPQGISCFI